MKTRSKNEIHIVHDTAVLVVVYKGEKYETVLDARDVQKVASYSWSLRTQFYKYGKPLKSPTVYISGSRPDGRGGQRCIYLHRLLMAPPKGLVVDHINGDGMDNRRENLRVVTRAQNAQNRKTVRASSGVRNVYYRKRTGNWLVQIHSNGQFLNFGTYPTLWEAEQVAERERPRILEFSSPAARHISAATA